MHLTEVQAQQNEVSLTDSCAVPGHSMIDRVWPDRMQVMDCLISTDGGSSLPFRWACGIDGQRRRLRKLAKDFIRRT